VKETHRLEEKCHVVHDLHSQRYQPHDWKVEQLLTVESKTLDGYVVLTFPVGELAGMKEKHSRRYHSNVPKELCAGRDDREDVNQ
jgi:hypothetical protein